MDINGLDINYKISGPDDAAHTMVILQGWGTEMGLYDSVAAAVNDTYRVVQFDLPGFGASDEPKEPWNVDAYADFFCGFMEKLGIKKAVLFGHSYGGRVIIKLAARENLPFEIKRQPRNSSGSGYTSSRETSSRASWSTRCSRRSSITG